MSMFRTSSVPRYSDLTVPVHGAPGDGAARRAVVPAVVLCLGSALAAFALTRDASAADATLFAPAAVRPAAGVGITRAPLQASRPHVIRRSAANEAPTARSVSGGAPLADGPSLPHGTAWTWGFATTGLGLVLAGLGLLGLAAPASAFDNALPEYAEYVNVKKRPGVQADDLGLAPRAELKGAPGLKVCGMQGLPPNCFSTSGPDADHAVAPLVPPKGKSQEAAIADIRRVVERYPVGQQNVDGGGFRIVASEPKYLYAQFESLKQGFIDDVEFAADPNGTGILWRTSSRIGVLDVLVNAKRANWILAELEKAGWTAPQLTEATYPEYFQLNTFQKPIPKSMLP